MYMSISNEPEVRGYGDLVESLPPGSRLIMVMGELEPDPWIRSGVNPEILVKGERLFAAEWPAHAEKNESSHVWISAAVTVDLPEIKAASVTRETLPS